MFFGDWSIWKRSVFIFRCVQFQQVLCQTSEKDECARRISNFSTIYIKSLLTRAILQSGEERCKGNGSCVRFYYGDVQYYRRTHEPCGLQILLCFSREKGTSVLMCLCASVQKNMCFCLREKHGRMSKGKACASV